MDLQDIQKFFPISLPIAKNGVIWNGRPGEFGNVPGMNFSQEFGYTPYASTRVTRTNSKGETYRDWMYGTYNGKKRPHNGIDLAGFKNTELVFPCDCWLSYTGYDKDGYGNFAFFETDSIKRNGVRVKVEYVLAHMNSIHAQPYKHYKKGDLLGYMGTTGMSTGCHTHFGVRPLVEKENGSWEYLFKDEESMAARGYIDPVPCLDVKPIYDKQKLINIKSMLDKNEKKLIIEGEEAGRKYVVVNGKLREIKKGREAVSALYIMANNGMGETTSSEVINNMPKGEDF